MDAIRNAELHMASLSSRDITDTDFAGEKIDCIIDRAAGDNAAIGGIKVSAPEAWFAARPSGTEDTYKIYAGSFRGAPQLQQILKEAQATVDAVIARL